MKYLLTLLAFVISIHFVQAQTGAQLDVTAPGTSNGYGTVRFDNPAGNKIGDIEIGDITGTPYYKNNWSKGVIILSNDKAISLSKVKLNLCNNEVHYIDFTGLEMAVDDKNLKKIILFDAKDTAKTEAVFVAIKGFMGNAGVTLMQVLNQGAIQLLKINAIEVKKGDYDVMMGKNKYTFQPKISYAFYKDGEVVPCKTLTKADIFTSLLPDADANTWLTTNKNKLKNEKDVTAFLDYYNSRN